jgi:hypothetical protein
MATSDRFSSLALPLDYPQKCDRFQSERAITSALAPSRLRCKRLTVESYQAIL